MKAQSLLALSTVLFICACESDNDPAIDTFKDPLLGIADKGHISFENPQVGQRNYYVQFKAIKTSNGDILFSYLADTVVMGIVSQTTKGWQVTQHLTRRSKLVTQNSISAMADSIFTYQMEIHSDSVRFKKKGLPYLSFIPVPAAALPLNVPAAAISKADCAPELNHSIEKWYTYSNSCMVLGREYDSVIGYRNYVDMATDGFGFVYDYQIENGFTRIAWISAWRSNEAEGYDLVSRN